MNGRGYVEPNPMVGCVLVKNGQTIGEGWHQKFGEPHAEPTALNDCKTRGNDPAGATAYVTLEPCCHTNKKTPPCTPRLIEAKIARVVIGCLDPNPDVNGKGVAMLRAAGIEVDVSGETPSAQDAQGWPSLGVRALDASHFRQLIAPFTLRQRDTRPYVTLKWAQSADGYVAGRAGQRRQISNATSIALVHQLRARSDAIVVGINTVLHDDPLLTTRDVSPLRTTIRVVLDSHLRTPLTSQLVTTARNQPVKLYCYRRHFDSAAYRALMAHGVDIVDLDPNDLSRHDGDQRMSLREMLCDLYVDHVLVEPGPTLAKSFIDENLVDRVWLFRAPHLIDAETGPRATALPDSFLPVATHTVAGDTLTEYLNTKSPAFFAATPSADFVLAAESV